MTASAAFDQIIYECTRLKEMYQDSQRALEALDEVINIAEVNKDSANEN